jgi:hypothetical protein
MFQANAGSRREVQRGILNNSSLKEARLVMITKTHIINVRGNPHVHQRVHWTALWSTLLRQDLVSHSFMSLIYVDRKLRIEQVAWHPLILSGGS